MINKTTKAELSPERVTELRDAVLALIEARGTKNWDSEDIRRQRLKHHDVTKVGGHRSHRVITTHSDHPARRRTFATRSHRGNRP